MSSGTPFDDAAKLKFLEHVAEGKSGPSAAEECGLTWGTVRSHLRDDLEFSDGLAVAAEIAAGLVEDALHAEAVVGNVQAIKFYLLNRAPHRWKDESIIRKEVSGPGGGPITVIAAQVQAVREVVSGSDRSEGDQALDHLIELPVGNP